MVDKSVKYQRMSVLFGIMGVVFVTMGLSLVFFTGILKKDMPKEEDKEVDKKTEIVIQNNEVEEEKNEE